MELDLDRIQSELKMSLVESSNCDISLKSTWILSHVQLEGTRKEKFSSQLVNLIFYLGKMRKPAKKINLDGLFQSGNGT
jgi:hypothetical protein